MDRGRHRAFLKRLLWFGVMAAGFLTAAAPTYAQGNASPVPSVSVPTPSTSATPDAAARTRAAERMIERRQRDLAASEEEAQKRIDQLPPEEREAFKRNLKLWRELSPPNAKTCARRKPKGCARRSKRLFSKPACGWTRTSMRCSRCAIVRNAAG